eukprot:COSAG02_NODE_2617_length_8409_cov_2.491697_6_plen_197_part_00
MSLRHIGHCAWEDRANSWFEYTVQHAIHARWSHPGMALAWALSSATLSKAPFLWQIMQVPSKHASILLLNAVAFWLTSYIHRTLYGNVTHSSHAYSCRSCRWMAAIQSRICQATAVLSSAVDIALSARWPQLFFVTISPPGNVLGSFPGFLRSFEVRSIGTTQRHIIPPYQNVDNTVDNNLRDGRRQEVAPALQRQ